MTKFSPLIIILALVVLSVAGYVVYQKSSSVSTKTEETTSTASNVQKTADGTPVGNAEIASDTATQNDNTAEQKASDAMSDNPNGIHIMTDGKVMAKDGKVVAGATIREDGKVVLGDGSVITPAFDMRSDTDTKPVATTPVAAAHVIVDIVGTDYDYDIKQIKVKKGDTVTINFKSDKGFHDLVVDEFNAATARVNEGKGSTSVTFVADTVGTFQYYCSVMNHREKGMIGYLTVAEK